MKMHERWINLNDPLKYRWLIFCVLGASYFFVCLHRISPTVIARDLVSEFGASATALGLMSSAYFYLYAAVQPAVGVLADSWGARRLVTVFTLIACLGAVVFGTAANMTVATAGRALIGIGVGGVFVPALKIFSRWFRAKGFASVTGFFLACGNAGNLSASLPLTYLILALGWRFSLLSIGAASLLLAILCWIVIRNQPEDRGWQIEGADHNTAPSAPQDGMTDLSTVKRLEIVFRNPGFWMVTLATFFFGGSALTFQGLWAVPYLMDVYGYNRVQAGGFLMLLPIGFIIGAPLIGYLSDKLVFSRKSILLCSLSLGVVCWSFFFTSGGRPDSAYLVPLFLIMGTCGGGSLSLFLTITKELFPQSITGTSVGLMNTAAFLSTAVYQPVSGYLMDTVGRSGSIYPVEAYYQILTFFFISMVMSLICIIPLGVPRSKPSDSS
jgi:sugar phosphate permease